MNERRHGQQRSSLRHPVAPCMTVQYHAQVADPEDACANLSVPVLDSKPWIALIKRSERARTDCSFDIKVGSFLTRLSYALSVVRGMASTGLLEQIGGTASHWASSSQCLSTTAFAIRVEAYPGWSCTLLAACTDPAQAASFLHSASS